ncbi:hypothetical protein OZX58_02620 [Lactobacillus sp. ESL0680]|uniref:hypothetical protein n=1 Tax=Lactobacillus sp. ESL0680 TaxID=2983210 RepID=UPI0023F7FA2E|nr:hypothetical protein [Lactobacillus sp. ESL0680]WEV39149.1 hypothetical protein OZX58_02620 [Lactobacillus sp. ESL0680]
MDIVIAFGLSFAATIWVLAEIISSLIKLTDNATKLISALNELRAALKNFKVKNNRSSLDTLTVIIN